MKAELVPENGDPPIPIERDLVIVGRRGYCDVVIEHPSLSKRHCALIKTDGLLIIRDLISTNGTKVKGQRIRWAALLPNDRIALGSYKLRVYLGPDDVPGPSERHRSGRRLADRPGSPRTRGRHGSEAGTIALSGPVSPEPPHAARSGEPVRGFAAPSPLEVDVAPPERDLAPSPRHHRRDQSPLLEIDLDEDDVIDLD